MKKLVAYLLFIFFVQYAYCQETKTILDKYEKAKTTGDKFRVIIEYTNALTITTEEKFASLNNLYIQFTQKKDMAGIGTVQCVIGSLYWQHDDYVNSLKYYISALKNFEEIKDSTGIMQ